MRRRYNYHQPSSGSNVGTVEVGETHVKVCPPGSSVAISAEICGRTFDAQNRLTSIVLRSLVHESHRTDYGDYTAYGCFVTEFHVKERLLDPEPGEGEEAGD